MWQIKMLIKQQNDCTRVLWTVDNYRPLYRTMPQVLRERTLGTLAAGTSTRAAANKHRLHFIDGEWWMHCNCDPLVDHSSSLSSSHCCMIMHGPMLQGHGKYLGSCMNDWIPPRNVSHWACLGCSGSASQDMGCLWPPKKIYIWKP